MRYLLTSLLNVVLIVVVIIGPFFVQWQIALIFWLHWYSSLLCQSLYHHRYATHRAFRMVSWQEKFFQCFSWISMGSSHFLAAPYAIMHQAHHDFSDQEKDPHSPHHSKNIATMMAKTLKCYNQLKKDREGIARVGLHQLQWVEKISESWLSRIFFGVLYVVTYCILIYSLGLSPWWYALLPVHFFMSPIHGAIVNWFGHWLGYQNYDNQDHSRNTLFWDFLMLGELFQNNHHKIPKDVCFAKKKWEIDPLGWLIKGFIKIGIFKPPLVSE